MTGHEVHQNPGETLSLVAQGEAALHAVARTGKRCRISLDPVDELGAEMRRLALRSRECVEDAAAWIAGPGGPALTFNYCGLEAVETKS